MGSSDCLDPDDPDAQWPYCPSFSAAVAFAVIFGISTVGHLTQAIYHKKGFAWVVCMAAIWETAGLSLRSMGAKEPRNDTWPQVSNMLVLLSPLWINAFAYMIGGRMVYFWLPQRAVWKFKARFFTRIFVWADVGSFLVQATGGTMLSSDDPDTAKIGRNVYMGGIGGQQAFVLLFLGLMIGFHLEARRCSTHRATPWAPFLYALYVVLLLITVRVIYRLVEFSSGVDGPIPRHEYFFYVFEATPMALALIVLNVMHPGRYLTGEGSEFAKPLITKGDRRWWCCGKRRRTKVYQEGWETTPEREQEDDRYEELLPVTAGPGDQRSRYHHRYQHSASSLSDGIDAEERPGRYYLLPEEYAGRRDV